MADGMQGLACMLDFGPFYVSGAIRIMQVIAVCGEADDIIETSELADVLGGQDIFADHASAFPHSQEGAVSISHDLSKPGT